MDLLEIGTNEVILIGLVAVLGIFFLIRLIYVSAKRKGRIEELEKRVRDTSKNQ